MRWFSVVVLALLITNTSFAANPRPTGKMTVIAEGAAAVEGNTNPREKAINDALRNAIMNAAGAYVSSVSRGQDFELSEDRILVKAQGFAHLDEVLEERTLDGILRVKVRATVSTKPLAEILKGSGITRNWKVAVMLQETANDRKTKPSAGPEIEKALIGAGFRTIDRSWNDKITKDKALALAEEGDRTALSRLKQEYGVDVLVVGDASAEAVDVQKEGGLRFVRSIGTAQARAFFTDTAEVVTVVDAAEMKLGETEAYSAREALKAAGRSLSAKLVEDLLVAPAELSPFVTVKISGFTKAADASRFEKALQELPGVRSVKRQRFTGGTDELNVYVNSEDLDSLAEAIEEHDYMRPYNVVISSWSKAMITGRIMSADPSKPKPGASYVVVPPKQ